MTAPSILISAGDPSGALHAARLAAALRQRTGATLFGLGTKAMEEAGVQLVGDAADIAVVGLSEAIEMLPRAWRLLGRLETEAIQRRPALAILVDAPDFNLRLAGRLRRQGIRIVYFISPQVWAWRSSRVRQIRERVERLLVIFPFEEKFYRDTGVPAEFVGHPLADVVHAEMGREEFCHRHLLDPSRPLLALLPGSRPKEVEHNLPPMLAACRQLGAGDEAGPQLTLAAAPGLGAADFAPYLKKAPPVRIVERSTWEALAAADVAIVSSGTATIDAALLGTPMVVVYRVSAASAFILRHLIKVPYYSMVNLLLARRAVPELVQRDFTPARVAEQVGRLLQDARWREGMKRDLAEVRERLASPDSAGAVARAADVIASLLRTPQPSV